MTKAKTHAELTKEPKSHKRKGPKAPRHPHRGRLGSAEMKKRIKEAAEKYPLKKKQRGGMTRVGLSPAEEARAGTMPEAKRAKYMAKGGKINKKKPQSTAAKKEAAERRRDKIRLHQGERFLMNLLPEVEEIEEKHILKEKKKPKPKKPTHKRLYEGMVALERKAKEGGKVMSKKRGKTKSFQEISAADRKRRVQKGKEAEAKRRAKSEKESQAREKSRIKIDPEELRRKGDIAAYNRKHLSPKQRNQSLWKSLTTGGFPKGKSQRDIEEEQGIVRPKDYGPPRSWRRISRAKGGKVGNKKSQGKRISNKQTDGNKLVASLYD